MILSLEDISFRYVTQPILDHVSFVVNDHDKWGVVGLNGAGKSTLLSIMAGKEKADDGKITMMKDCRISYCPQTMDFPSGKSVYDTVRSCMNEETEVYQIHSILNKLGITDYDQQIDILSGGQKKRVALAIALIRKADLYLLDEPTNHLDQDMIVWLEKYLMKVNKAVVLVTHDRYFLSRITNHIVEVSDGHLYTYTGGYADYLEQREIRRQQALASEAKRQNYLRSEIEWIRAGAQARSTKQKSRIQRYERIAAMEAPKETQTLELKSAATRLGRNTIEISHISKAYDNKDLFSDFSCSLQRMDRIGIIGPNGCGKSTLLKIIMGQVQPDAGSVSIGETVKLGYFAQHNEVFEKEGQRVIDYLEDFGKVVYTADHEEISASQMLERFLFDKDRQYQPIAKCSGGEKRRLYLCSILMQAPNILILDEPTNDLDTDTLTILEGYLEDFHGAVLAVSHDRYFLDRIADKLFVFENGTIQIKQQLYSDYLEEKQKKQSEPKVTKEDTRPRQNTVRLTYMEKKELEKLNEQVPAIEEEVAALEEQLNCVTAYEDIRRISQQLEERRKRMEEMENRFLELSEKDQ
ncbi:MAG: ABC-F family ATP-binding cassette domain-containing protein [Bulleidia sp.]|nr:ABC-F family ATP-binding cassette domain-containing protein [Bulleidia sp.]